MNQLKESKKSEERYKKVNGSFHLCRFFFTFIATKNKIMSKNKLIALAIIAFLVILPFQWAYVDFTVESQLTQALTMALVIIGSIVAILMFNKGESSH